MKGKLSYTRLTYRHSEDPFHSGTDRENISVEKAVSLMSNYLKRMRSAPDCLCFQNGKILSEVQQVYIYSLTSSEAWIGKTPPFTEEEYKEMLKLIEVKFSCLEKKEKVKEK